MIIPDHSFVDMYINGAINIDIDYASAWNSPTLTDIQQLNGVEWNVFNRVQLHGSII